MTAEPVMNFCVNCAKAKPIPGPPGSHPRFSCLHKEYTDPVTGMRYHEDCAHVRMNENKCGMGSVWFSPAPEKSDIILPRKRKVIG